MAAHGPLEGFYYGGHVVSDRTALTALCLLFDRLHLATPYDRGEQLPGVISFKRASRVLAARRGAGALAARAVLDMLVDMLKREEIFLIKLGGEHLIRQGLVVPHGELPGGDAGTRARILSAPKAKLASIFRAGAASVAVATGLSLSAVPTIFVGSNAKLPVPAAAVILKDGNFMAGRLDALRVELPFIQIGGLPANDLLVARERMAETLEPYRQTISSAVAAARRLLSQGSGRAAIEAEVTHIAEDEVRPAGDRLRESLESAKGAVFRRLRRLIGPPHHLSLRAVPGADIAEAVASGAELVGGLDEVLGGRESALARISRDGGLALELRPMETLSSPAAEPAKRAVEQRRLARALGSTGGAAVPASGVTAPPGASSASGSSPAPSGGDGEAH